MRLEVLTIDAVDGAAVVEQSVDLRFSSALPQFDSQCAAEVHARMASPEREQQITSLARATAQGIVEIGARLIDSKRRVRHRQFLAWIAAEFQWSRMTAERFMNVCV